MRWIEAKKLKAISVPVIITMLAIVFVAVREHEYKKKESMMEESLEKSLAKQLAEVRAIEKTPIVKEGEVDYFPDIAESPFRGSFDLVEKMEVTADTENINENIVLPEMVLHGMVWDSVRPQAIINDTIYDINSTIETYGTGSNVKIEGITNEGIQLRYKDKEFVIKP